MIIIISPDVEYISHMRSPFRIFLYYNHSEDHCQYLIKYFLIYVNIITDNGKWLNKINDSNSLIS